MLLERIELIPLTYLQDMRKFSNNYTKTAEKQIEQIFSFPG